MESPIFALEGSAFAGKTTLINFLKDNHSSSVVVIPEASEYIGGDKNLPNIPFDNCESAKANTYFFVEIEKRRCEDAIKANKKTGLPVLMDRSTPISSLFFYLLLKHVKFQNPEFLDGVYQHALEAFQTQIDKGDIFIPNKLIYLKPLNKNVFIKRLERGTKNNVFTSWENYRFLDEKYNTLIKCHFPNKNSLSLSSENSNENLKNLAKRSMLFFEHPGNPSTVNQIFKNFLNEKRKFILDIDASEDGKYMESANKASSLMDKAKI